MSYVSFYQCKHALHVLRRRKQELDSQSIIVLHNLIKANSGIARLVVNIGLKTTQSVST